MPAGADRVSVLPELPDTGLMRGNLRRAVAEWDGNPVVGAYLWWWSSGRFGCQPEDRWDGLLHGVRVELRGPAEAVPVDAELVARVLRGLEPDPSCDIGFCNHQFWRRVDKSRVRLAMVSKGDESDGMRGGRRLWDTRVLFAGGDWNMVPAAMLDLLTGGPRLTITGATFYAAGRDYADQEDSNDLPSILHHNPLVNRRVVKNLWDAGVVDAAGLTGQVLALTDDEYAATLIGHRGL
jgi:hypothetical protein